MPLDPPRSTRDGKREAGRESSQWLTLAEFARLAGVRYGTMYARYKRGRLVAPDAAHPKSPLWLRSTAQKYLEDFQDSVLTTLVQRDCIECINNDSSGEEAGMPDGRSFGQGSIARLLNYFIGDTDRASASTVATMMRHGRLPKPDRRDWYTNTPRWFADTVADWLIDNPQYLARVTDKDMLALVSQRKRRK